MNIYAGKLGVNKAINKNEPFYFWPEWDVLNLDILFSVQTGYALI